MTDIHSGRAATLLARFPGPVRLTPRPAKWLLFAATSAAAGGFVLWILWPEDQLWMGSVGGWLVVAGLALNLMVCIGHLLPGVAYLALDAEGFETKTPFKQRAWKWKTASRFRPEGANASRHVAFDVFTNEPPRSALFNYLIQRQRTLPDNYGIPHDELARLMNEWRAKAVGVSTPSRPSGPDVEKHDLQPIYREIAEHTYAEAAKLPLKDAAFLFWLKMDPLNQVELPPVQPTMAGADMNDPTVFRQVALGAISSVQQRFATAEDGPTFGRLKRTHPGASDSEVRAAIRAAVTLHEDCMESYSYSGGDHFEDMDRAIASARQANPGFLDRTYDAALTDMRIALR